MSSDKTTNLDEIIAEVNLLELTSKAGNTYSMIQMVFESGDDIRMMTPDFSTGKLLKQELELAKFRSQAK